MKNQYVGDIGDYGKYGLLRFLADHGVRIGVNWYLTEDDGSADGKFTGYLNQPAYRSCDPELFDTLREIVERPDKSVKMIEEYDVIPEAEYYSAVLKHNSLSDKGRKWDRVLWFNNSNLFLQDSELIFADPDNGITYRKTAANKGSEKYILPEEICDYYKNGKDVVYYCHKGRRKQEDWEQSKTAIRKYLVDAQILAVTSHRGTQRSYIFVLHPRNYLRYKWMLSEFLNSEWKCMFTWESISGNAFQNNYPEGNAPAVPLEVLDLPFSVCKVADYSGGDFEQPFVFTGRTDQEKSLVCPTDIVPQNTIEREDGWRAFRVFGKMDFSLIGILDGITSVLAEGKVSVFAISTYDTDYVLTREVDFRKAILLLKGAGYSIKERESDSHEREGK